MHIVKKWYLLATTILLLSYSVVGQVPKSSVSNFNQEDGKAIQGYDPVSYFVDGKAEEGSREIKTIHKGILYQFASEINKKLFLQNPDSYEPQYGGWCAYAMGKDGSRVEIDPETFKIINGELHLFYHSLFNNTLIRWNEDEKRLKNQADRNWQKQIKKGLKTSTNKR